ncbi:putative selenium metabolism protein SsnA [Desulfosporosinus orientis DSM 765]|uniref:Putative selenium metabolism protein SsnA n=1 Tax=Desulfosporosinus orientis (strain ATCC 19365 / DSM 765 / NCIMB 8382 / VKM B-1628 / Singapore I) TaxID=768706 RepID=G7W5T7_DESOD|nr:putative aminohydrolase SsnA [Desulfosporosinus orientis]AET67025.1 putative selenium metabolism protein SsnA [Desulfosporosinus orientis DSM 765]
MILVGNGTILTLGKSNQVIQNGGVLIQDTKIKEVGSTTDLRGKYPDAEFIDARGRLIMPGMINTHMHLYSTFARGMDAKSKPPQNFGDILEGLWWKLDKLLTLDDVYYSGLTPLIECIKTGTTTIIDHHASPMAITGSLSILAKAAKEMGVRASFCYEVSDRNGEAIAEEGIKENADFIAACQAQADPMVAGMFGLHASLTLSDQTLTKCCEEVKRLGAGFHVHVAEGREDLEDSLSKYGMRVVERLDKFGVLGPKTLAVHCVHIDNHEIELLKSSQTQVVHNPESNMGNAVGVTPVLEMLKRGVKVGLGTDGYTCDMFESGKVANVLHKHAAANPSVAWGEVPQMLYGNNPEIAANLFGGKFGELTEGAWADVIVVDYIPPTPLGSENWSGHLLFGVSGRSVETTIINGRVRMQDRKLIGIDEEAIGARSRELAQALWNRI